MNGQDDIVATALEWARQGRRVALATVVATWGSSPRGVGSRLAVDEDGRFIGSVSGGCVEGEILAMSEDVIASGRPLLREFGVSDEKAWSVGLACGGEIGVFIERIDDAGFLQNLIDGVQAGRDAATIVALDNGERILFDPDLAGDAEWDDLTRRQFAAAAARGADALLETPRGRFFLEYWRPPLRLAVVGATHIAQGLAPIAMAAGYQVAVIDPRGAFATKQRFPGVTLLNAWPGDVLPGYRLDSRTALVALSHEPRIDDPAILAALQSPAFYIGALGSRSSAEKRRSRFRALGYSDSALSRVHGPVGLDIGAATPAEIAIAIAAEITAVLRLDRSIALGSAAE
jgi:xanthine dehydrogenase accessory factor